MRWALAWLGLGFLKKWVSEWAEKWGPKMFDVLITLLSFSLIYVLFGALHVTTWQAFIVFLFWLGIIAVVKVE